jgi:hypothetical protein
MLVAQLITFAEAEAGADQHGEPCRFLRRVPGPVNEPEVFDEEDINRHEDEQDENDRAHERGVEERDRAGSEEGKDESGDRGRQNRRPIDRHMARVALHRDRCAGEGGELVRAENRRDRRARQENEHRGNLDQPAAAYHGVDKSCEERRRAEQQNQGHGGLG